RRTEGWTSFTPDRSFLLGRLRPPLVHGRPEHLEVVRRLLRQQLRPPLVGLVLPLRGLVQLDQPLGRLRYTLVAGRRPLVQVVARAPLQLRIALFEQRLGGGVLL